MGKAQRKDNKPLYEIDPTIKPRLLEVLSEGATIADACASVGITDDTMRNWAKRDSAFSAAVKAARAQGRIDSLRVIRRASNESWQAAAWFLERSDPMNWGRRDMLISLGIDPTILKALKQQADSAGVDLADIFEAMINELGNGAEDRASQSETGGLRASNS